jgi:hypothetical protein
VVVFKEIDGTSGIVRTWRYNLANDIAISTDTKLQVLQKAGWRGAKQLSGLT